MNSKKIFEGKNNLSICDFKDSAIIAAYGIKTTQYGEIYKNHFFENGFLKDDEYIEFLSLDLDGKTVFYNVKSFNSYEEAEAIIKRLNLGDLIIEPIFIDNIAQNLNCSYVYDLQTHLFVGLKRGSHGRGISYLCWQYIFEENLLRDDNFIELRDDILNNSLFNVELIANAYKLKYPKSDFVNLERFDQYEYIYDNLSFEDFKLFMTDKAFWEVFENYLDYGEVVSVPEIFHNKCDSYIMNPNRVKIKGQFNPHSALVNYKRNS